MNIERILFWLRLVANVILRIFQNPGTPAKGPANAALTAPWEDLKPERVQFWLELIARFVLEVLDGLEEPGQGVLAFGRPWEELKPERVQIWLRAARSILDAMEAEIGKEGVGVDGVDGVDGPEPPA